MAITGRRTELERLTERLAVNFKLLAACKVHLRLIEKIIGLTFVLATEVS
jgi:hypothetical protein